MNLVLKGLKKVENGYDVNYTLKFDVCDRHVKYRMMLSLTLFGLPLVICQTISEFHLLKNYGLS